MQRARLILVLSIAGCSDSQAGPGNVSRDSAGVEIVEATAPAWSAGQGWRLGTEPVLSIGDAEGDSAYLFNGIAGAHRLASGGIVVADGGSSEIQTRTERTSSTEAVTLFAGIVGGGRAHPRTIACQGCMTQREAGGNCPLASRFRRRVQKAAVCAAIRTSRETAAITMFVFTALARHFEHAGHHRDGYVRFAAPSSAVRGNCWCCSGELVTRALERCSRQLLVPRAPLSHDPAPIDDYGNLPTIPANRAVPTARTNKSSEQIPTNNSREQPPEERFTAPQAAPL